MITDTKYTMQKGTSYKPGPNGGPISNIYYLLGKHRFSKQYRSKVITLAQKDDDENIGLPG
jgi:hypothetical protein